MMRPIKMKIAIAETVSAAAERTTKILQSFPSTKKRVFYKSYNRRPRKKQKQALGSCELIINAALTVSQLYMILSQPIPRYKN